MKINEVRTDVSEDLRGAIYRASGGTIGGVKGQQSAIKTNYITRFINQLKLNTQAAKRAGQPFDMKSFLDRYVSQYGWDLSNQEQASLDKMAEASAMTNNSNQSLTKIANYMYMLASQNQGASPGGRSSAPTTPKPRATGGSGGAAPPPPPTPGPSSEKVTVGGQTLDPKNPADAKILQQLQQQQAGAATQTTAKQQAGEPISPTAEKIMAAMGSLRGPTMKEDLDKILRDAAYLLSRIDKPRYSSTLRELTAGVSGQAAAGTKASMYSDVQQKTTPQASTTPQQYKNVEQALPGYGKATDELANKMNPPPPAKSSAERAYRPGTRPQRISDITPRMKKK